MQNWFKGLFQTTWEKTSGLAEGREQILNAVYLTGAILGPVALLVSLTFVYQEDRWRLGVVDSLAVLWFIVGVACRRRLAFRLRAQIAVGLLYLVGAIVLWTVGPASGWLVWFFTFAVLTGVFFGLRAGTLALVLNVVTLLGAWWLFSQGQFSWIARYAVTDQQWLVLSISFLMLNFLTATSLAVVFRNLAGALEKESVALRGLEEANRRLLEERQERLAAENALRRSEERYRLISENTADVIWLYDLTLEKFSYISPSIQRLRGYSPEEVMNKPVKHVLTKESFRLLSKNLMPRIATLSEGDGSARIYTIQVDQPRKDGSIVPTEIVTTLLTDPHGKATQVLGVTRDITERKRAEEEIKRREEELRLITDNLPAYIAYVGMDDLRYHFVNRQFEEGFKVPRERIVGMHIKDLIGETNYQFALPHIEKVRAGEPASYENAFRLAEGRRWAKVNYVPDFGEGGKVRGIVVLTFDITERKLAAEALETSEARLKRAQSVAHVGNFEVDLSNNVVWGSEEAFRVYGLEPTSSLELPLAEAQKAVTAEDRPRLDRALKEFKDGGKTYDQEFRIRRLSDGEIRFIHSKAELISDDAGNPVRIEGTVQDITELRRADEELRNREATLRTIYQASPIGIGMVSVPDRVLGWTNEKMSEMTGYSAEELMGMPSRRLYTGREEYDRVGCIMQTSVRATGLGSVESQFLRKDGTVLDVLLSSAPLDPSDLSAGMVFTALDITQSKKVAEERSNLETQLRQAQKMEAIGTLAGGIAHDFNNILAAVMGYGELALELAGQAKSNSEEIKQIIKASERAKNLVRQILTFSRKGEAQFKPLSLNEKVVETVRMLDRTIPKNIGIETSLTENLKKVNADAGQIEQVLVNLASNARDAMPDGGRLVIRTGNADLDRDYCRQHVEVRSGSYVLLQVQDTGIGMDSKTLDQIFNPFFTTKEVGKGTGLGLATVHGIVKTHGGHISCYSEPSRGTLFRIYLPAYETEVPADTPADETAAEPAGGSERILIVDDEPALRDLGVEMLQRMGYDVITARNGEEALDIFSRKKGTLDLVILDLGMPGMGGFKCLKKIRAIDPKARVIVASGYSADRQIKDVLAAGAAGFISKPFLNKDLLGKVREVLEKKQYPSDMAT
ncbi:MAG: PAS domain S-box protein [Deltaproteobacteria bacterium]|nr:PAS domain S-box protein [Deltaproteobacteria bacterium]